jgi:hypothetical protein
LLRPAKEAFHDAPNASETCLEGTRQQLLAELTSWLNSTEPSDARVAWLSGLAGTGKTTVARTMADWAYRRGQLAAAYFFSRNTETTRVPSAIIPTLGYQLARYQRSFRSHICAGIESDEDVRDRSIASQATTLLGGLSSTTTPSAPLLIVVDALDECHLENGCEGGHAIPSLLVQIEHVPFVKILLTSRVENTIERMLVSSVKHTIALHNIEAKVVESDIHHYLTRSFETVAVERGLAPAFPTEGAVDTLVRRAGTLFIYAATVVKWVSDPKEQPDLRLAQVLKQDADEMPSQYQPLDRMYFEILSQTAQTTGSVKVRVRALGNILSAVVLLQEPVKESVLASLAGEETQARSILPLLSSVLVLGANEPVRLFHASFPDFVMDPERCRDERFLVTRQEGHLRLASRCLDIMNNHLVQNICGIGDPSLRNSEIVDLEQLLQRAAPPELRYASRYWHVHVCSVNLVSASLLSRLETFCTIHLLHWIELTSLLNEVPSALMGIRSILTYLRVRTR